MINEKFISKRNGRDVVTLSDHTKMVINLAIETARANIKNVSNELLQKIAVAAALHDIGKCSKAFQNYIAGKNSTDDEGMESDNGKGLIIYHNSVSWAFAYSCLGLDKGKYQPIRSAVLYHHTVKGDSSITSSSIIGEMMRNDAEGFGGMKEIYSEMLRYIDDTFSLGVCGVSDFLVKDVSDEDDLASSKIEDEKIYELPSKAAFDGFPRNEINRVELKKHEEKNWESAIIRAIVVSADRTVSSLRYDNDKILSNDVEYINGISIDRLSSSYSKEPDFSVYDQNRLQEQRDIVNNISNGGNGIYDIAASAGFGKTLIGLMHHFQNMRKTMWVVPRTIIADGTYNSIISELKTMGMNDEVKVGLMYGGEMKKCNFSVNPSNSLATMCDILVVVIDSFLSRYSRNDLSTMLVDSYFGDVIFDEYHEFVCNEPLFAAFVNTVYGRNNHTNTKTLFLSATGFPTILERLVGKINVITPKIYGGNTKVEINVSQLDSVSDMQCDDCESSFTIMPVVSSAQELYMRNNWESMLIHARYTDEDRAENERRVYEMYGKHKSKSPIPVIGTSIIGTGLDISAKSITHYMPTPETTIQISCGRSSRFNEHEAVRYNVIRSKDHKKFLDGLYDSELRNMWLNELQSISGKEITKNYLYELRANFIKRNEKKLFEFIVLRYKNSSISLSEIRYKGGYAVVDKGYDLTTKSYTYRGASNNFYATVKMDNGYLTPMLCDGVLLTNETSGGESKVRYNFMLSNKDTGFNFPNEKELKYAYSIKKWGDATVERCAALAYRNDRPFLLQGYRYSKEIGLYEI